MRVHNHGPEEGKSFMCKERIINGELKGECLAAPTIADRGDEPMDDEEQAVVELVDNLAKRFPAPTATGEPCAKCDGRGSTYIRCEWCKGTGTPHHHILALLREKDEEIELLRVSSDYYRDQMLKLQYPNAKKAQELRAEGSQ